MVREILVVSRENLFGKSNSFEGLLALDKEKNFMDIILKNFEYRERNDSLEHDNSFKQIIPYVWLINPKTKKVFLYRRAETGNEKRLHNKYSGGIGGHIDKDTDEKAQNPIIAAMMRELHEEVVMKNYPEPVILGFLNNETGDVEKVHFGIVAIGSTSEEVKPAEDMDFGQFYTSEEVDALFAEPKINVENWTKISWPFVKNCLTENMP